MVRNPVCGIEIDEINVPAPPRSRFDALRTETARIRHILTKSGLTSQRCRAFAVSQMSTLQTAVEREDDISHALC